VRDFPALLVELEDPQLSGEPHGAIQGAFVLEELLEENAPGNGFILEGALENQCKLFWTESLEQQVYELS
jgi:hypothetical protein